MRKERWVLQEHGEAGHRVSCVGGDGRFVCERRLAEGKFRGGIEIELELHFERELLV